MTKKIDYIIDEHLPKTVKDQMDQLPDRILDYFKDWLDRDRTGERWNDGTYITPGRFRIDVISDLRHENEIEFYYSGKKQRMTVKECMDFLQSLETLDDPGLEGYKENWILGAGHHLIAFFREVEEIRRGRCNDMEAKNTSEYRLWHYFQLGGFQTNDNQEVGKSEEELARDKLQAMVEDEGVYIIHNGTTGAPDLIAVFKETKDFVNVKSTGELVKRASVTYSNVDQCPENFEALALKRPYFYLMVHDRVSDKWALVTVPVGTSRVKVTLGDFVNGLKLPESFGKP
jgi:hypothetical protein